MFYLSSTAYIPNFGQIITAIMSIAELQALLHEEIDNNHEKMLSIMHGMKEKKWPNDLAN